MFIRQLCVKVIVQIIDRAQIRTIYIPTQHLGLIFSRGDIQMTLYIDAQSCSCAVRFVFFSGRFSNVSRASDTLESR